MNLNQSKSSIPNILTPTKNRKPTTLSKEETREALLLLWKERTYDCRLSSMETKGIGNMEKLSQHRNPYGRWTVIRRIPRGTQHYL